MRNYDTLNERLGKRTALKVANNTRLNRRGEVIAVTLHSTDIATFQPDESVTLTSGGWLTPTTKDRLNWILDGLNIGVRIFAERSVWYVYSTVTHEKVGLFVDGLTLTPSGEWSGMGTLTQANTARKLADKINRYVRKFSEALKAGEVPAPSAGDCWYCYMRDVETGKPLGELVGTDHLTDHMDDDYYVPSLLFNAALASPNHVSRLVGHWLNEWRNGNMTADKWPREMLARDGARLIRRYLRQQFGLSR